MSNAVWLTIFQYLNTSKVHNSGYRSDLVVSHIPALRSQSIRQLMTIQCMTVYYFLFITKVSKLISLAKLILFLSVESSSIALDPFLLLGLGSAAVCTVVALGAAVWCRMARQQSLLGAKKEIRTTPIETFSPSDDDKNPDVIPCNTGKYFLITSYDVQ